MSKSRTVILSATLLLMAGCDTSVADGQRIVRQDSSGVEIVLNTGSDKHLPWDVELQWSIGGAEDARITLSQLKPHQLAMDHRGKVSLVDVADLQVIVVDWHGEVDYRFGQRGPGPGEWFS